jgi:hypothetical protein
MKNKGTNKQQINKLHKCTNNQTKTTKTKTKTTIKKLKKRKGLSNIARCSVRLLWTHGIFADL